MIDLGMAMYFFMVVDKSERVIFFHLMLHGSGPQILIRVLGNPDLLDGFYYDLHF